MTAKLGPRSNAAQIAREINREARGPLRSCTVATLPSASRAGMMIFVTDESGGAVPAFSDGSDWRRVTDRAVVT